MRIFWKNTVKIASAPLLLQFCRVRV